MLRLAQQKHELDLRWLKQEERMEKEQALMLSDLEEDNRRKLPEATLAELEITENVLEASKSLRDALSEVSAHSQKVNSVRLTDWVINASTEVANQPQVQDSRVEKERRPMSLTGVRSDVATEIALKDKAEAHERMKLCSGKPRTEDSSPPDNITRTKSGTNILASSSSNQTTSMRVKSESLLTSCIACEEKHPCGGVRHSARKRLPNGRNWLQATNFVYHDSMDNIRSANVQSRASA